ncbi:hypothetical protein EDC04DRAFT_2608142 [Pisolithus marmoratus]|nr:hypothetical protein EDC04DRAFT_2608142 [Pisolithus marmoratus]
MFMGDEITCGAGVEAVAQVPEESSEEATSHRDRDADRPLDEEWLEYSRAREIVGKAMLNASVNHIMQSTAAVPVRSSHLCIWTGFDYVMETLYEMGFRFFYSKEDVHSPATYSILHWHHQGHQVGPTLNSVSQQYRVEYQSPRTRDSFRRRLRPPTLAQYSTHTHQQAWRRLIEQYNPDIDRMAGRRRSDDYDLAARELQPIDIRAMTDAPTPPA